jgi:hypothetical protein
MRTAQGTAAGLVLRKEAIVTTKVTSVKGGRAIVWAICLLPPARASRHQGDPLRPSVLSPRGLFVKDRSHISVLLPGPRAAPYFLGTGAARTPRLVDL